MHCIYGDNVDTEVGYVYDVEHFGGRTIPPAPKQIKQVRPLHTIQCHSAFVLYSCLRRVCSLVRIQCERSDNLTPM